MMKKGYRKPERPKTFFRQTGVTLIELIVFIVVVNIALVAVMQIYGQALVNSVDPVVRLKASDIARANLDEVLARKFDENTPTGGAPACGTSGAPACLGISPEPDFDDVGDFNGYADNSIVGFPVAITVIEAGADLGLSGNLARKIIVTVGMPDGNSVSLAAYKANF